MPRRLPLVLVLALAACSRPPPQPPAIPDEAAALAAARRHTQSEAYQQRFIRDGWERHYRFFDEHVEPTDDDWIVGYFIDEARTRHVEQVIDRRTGVVEHVELRRTVPPETIAERAIRAFRETDPRPTDADLATLRTAYRHATWTVVVDDVDEPTRRWVAYLTTEGEVRRHGYWRSPP